MLMIAQPLCQTRWQCNSACITTAKLAQELRENQKHLNLINTEMCWKNNYASPTSQLKLRSTLNCYLKKTRYI